MGLQGPAVRVLQGLSRDPRRDLSEGSKQAPGAPKPTALSKDEPRQDGVHTWRPTWRPGHSESTTPGLGRFHRGGTSLILGRDAAPPLLGESFLKAQAVNGFREHRGERFEVTSAK